MLDITLPPQTSAKLRMHAYFSKFTREARGGQEEYWQEKLTEFDPELFLRWSHLHKHWLIIYDHKGRIDVVKVFKPCQPFGDAFEYVKYNSILTSRKLRRLKKEQDEIVEKDIDKKIDECGAEFGEELHHATRERVITDAVKDNQY